MDLNSKVTAENERVILTTFAMDVVRRAVQEAVDNPAALPGTERTLDDIIGEVVSELRFGAPTYQAVERIDAWVADARRPQGTTAPMPYSS